MAFAGFPKETVKFLAALSRNNDNAWFEQHREDYEAHYLAPAQAFVEALAVPLKKLDKGLHAEPRVNGSILRINRDVRFSKDKTPYKDHLDLWFWSGSKKGWDKSGFFFRLTPSKLILGGGMHGFTPPVLAQYREQVLDEKRGAALAKLSGALAKNGYPVRGESYKKTPRGIAPTHPRAALLKHGGLYAGWEGKHPKELSSAKLVDFVTSHYQAILPLHNWVLALSANSQQK